MQPEILEIVSGRGNPGIDPTMHIWGWEVPVYLFLGGLVAGLMVLLPALELRGKRRPGAGLSRLMPFAAIGLVSLGMGALFLDLENKLNVFRFYLSFQPTSPMSWGSWILLLVYPALLLLGLGSLSDQQRGWLKDRVPARLTGLLQRAFDVADGRRNAVLWTTGATGLALGAYTGLLLGTLVARPLWNSALLGPLFLVSGISTGAALLLLTPMSEEEHRTLTRWDVAAITTELALLALLLVDLSGGGASSAAAGSLLLGGPWTPWFWALVVVGGLTVPLLLDTVELRRRLPATLYSPVLVLIGGLALRWVLVAAGQESSLGLIP
jgi:protein NrfD